MLDPATGGELTTVAAGTVDDALAAVSAASCAGPAFAAMAPRDRSEILRRAFEMMIDGRESLAELLVREMGKALPEARSEITYAAEFFR